jgi:diaminohydroxyphosphoribosylaminopyrimidine deaminase / 5-amino-6-(5-phosphoribosylamino)uracil reductase
VAFAVIGGRVCAYSSCFGDEPCGGNVAFAEDAKFMARALALAGSVERTSPNPKVGAVIVRDGAVLAAAAHEGAGTPHAEFAALEDIDATGATLYVTLEPCSHHGKTGPCCEAVVAAGIRRVVAAMEDPDSRVRGRGFEFLRAHDVDVEVGVGGDDAMRLNAAYVRHRMTGRPLVTLKLALTLDGRMGARDGSARWITSPETRRRVHERRALCDAVVVGAGTVVADDPRLTARDVGADRQPLRVIVDASGRTAPGAAVFQPGAEVLVATTDASSHEVQTAWKEAGAEVVVLAHAVEGVDLGELLDTLGQKGVMDLYCEGGARLATSFLAAGRVDRIELHYAPKMVGDGGPAIGDLGIATMVDAVDWRVTGVVRSGPDVLVDLVRARG